MKHLGLFEGIGGFSLAARWMGWETEAYCEINPFCLKVLKHHFPNADILTDIKTTDFKKYANRIDIITGGFPCQPFSLSGEQEGEKDERYLFPEMFRSIREIKPRWIVAENVYGLLTRKFADTFQSICSQMEIEGYEVWPVVIPASTLGAPHQRDRVWIIAHANNNAGGGFSGSGQIQDQEERNEVYGSTTRFGSKRITANTESFRQKPTRDSREWGTGFENGNCNGVGNNAISLGQSRKEHRQAQSERFTKSTFADYWKNFPTQSPICIGDDGFSSRLDGITFSKWRNESIKAGGNAIVPQVAFEIFKAIDQYENPKHT